MAKGFHIGDFVQEDVSKINTAPEKIEYIPLDDIHPDPENFYSLDGIDALAENIELVGLLDPLRVRPGSEKQKYIVISGHRRRAACMLLRDGGNERYNTVPCIVQRVDDFSARAKLRLIFANSHTRVLTGKELAQQSQQVLALLLELKEKGVELPGRMRDHVAEALNVSASKLARVQAIQNNLIPALLEEYDAGRVNESVAYRISQETAEIQEKLSRSLGPALQGITAEAAERCIAALQPKDEQTEPAEPLTDHDMMVGALSTEPDAVRADENKRFWANMQEAADDLILKSFAAGALPMRKDNIDMLRLDCRSMGVCGYAADWQGSNKGISIGDINKPQIERTWTEVYDALAAIAINRYRQVLVDKRNQRNVKLKAEGPPRASALTDAAPEWQTGDPPEAGWFAVWARYSISPTRTWDPDYEVLYWTGEHWSGRPGGAKSLDYEVLGWWPLPEK